MGKRSLSVSFKNACIDMKDMSITECLKDDIKEYSLLDVLREWDGIEGISFTLRHDDDIPSTADGAAEENDASSE